MYLKMFGLKEKPFHITPNPRFIFLSKKHKEAFAHLLYGVRQRVGFLSLVGEVGTGKTTVLRTLLRQLEQANYQVALIFNPCLSALELLQSIHREFGIPYQEGDRNLASLHDTLNDFLLEQRKQGKTVVLVIDEAQNLDPAVLEQLRLLSNLETATDKLLQLIIVGQPELDEVLNRRELRQLKQRLAVRYRLTTMDAEDTVAYIRHRLKIAGFGGAKLFTDKALKKIYRLTDGLPRLINILCDRALLVAYTNEQHLVDPKVIAEAQRELSGGDLVKRRRWPWAVVLGLICVLAFLFGYFRPSFLGSAQHTSAAITDSEAALPLTSARRQQAFAVKEIIDLQRLEALKQKVASFGEAESAKISISAVLQRWGNPALKNYTAKVYHPLEGALRDQGMNTIRF
ncbi:MAG: AAA family ATPase, partial [Geopsychrobacter sp.]|nr:AAA family ATPase [Geopsychrobacter sp.]